MLQLLRRHKAFFFVVTVLGVLLRAYLLRRHFVFEGDSLVYGNIAKNWVLHGTYGLTDMGQVVPVDIRMPAYPAFLAACFRIFGMEHYSAVVRAQAVIDLLGCFVIAAGARRLAGHRAARVAFFLAALCPFTANYAATPLPETLAIFFAGLALLFALRATGKMRSFSPWQVEHTHAIPEWIGCGLAIAASIYLRPDGGVLLVAVGVYLLWLALSQRRGDYIVAGAVLGLVSLLPLIPWTVRNWRTLHVLQPLAPFYAELPNEYVPHGFNRWAKTWVMDFVSTMNVEWNVSTDVGGEAVDINDIPPRAFDNAAQREQVRGLFEAYNQTLVLTPEMDSEFDQIARERIREHPFRYYVSLPLARLADMWLRPRTELFDLDLDWWKFRDTKESVESIALAALDFGYLVLALASLRRRHTGAAVLWLFILCRSALLLTLSNPEQRYTLECFPAVLMLAGAALARENSSEVKVG